MWYMGQQLLVPAEIYDDDGEMTGRPAPISTTWEQTQLIEAPERSRSQGTKPGDRFRQAGLMGVAQARAALAEAARRAEARVAA
jgi:hypothetical protein